MPMRSNFNKPPPLPKPDKIPNYHLSFDTNANYHKTWENCLDQRGDEGKIKKKVASIEKTQKSKLQITLLEGKVSEFKKHSVISLAPTGVLEIRYRTERELHEMMIEMDSLLIPDNNESLSIIVRDFKRTLSIVELETKITRLRVVLDKIKNPKDGRGRLKKMIKEQTATIRMELDPLSVQYLLLTQNRYNYKKGQKWNKSEAHERLISGVLDY
jgi:hypothetical protein